MQRILKSKRWRGHEIEEVWDIVSLYVGKPHGAMDHPEL
jgi:hypothetical protein